MLCNPVENDPSPTFSAYHSDRGNSSKHNDESMAQVFKSISTVREILKSKVDKNRLILKLKFEAPLI